MPSVMPPTACPDRLSRLVDDLGVGDRAVGHGHLDVVTRQQSCGAQTNPHHLTTFAAVEVDVIADLERRVHDHEQPTKQVGERVLGGEADCDQQLQ